MSYTCKIDSIDHNGKVQSLGSINVLEEPADFVISLDEVTRQAMLGNLIN